MADPSTAPPLIPTSIRTAHGKIKQYIHHTPLLTNRSLSRIASSPDPSAFLADNPPPFPSAEEEGVPRFRIWMKCENQQRIGAFKARGAFHAVTRLVDEMGIDEVRRRGVVTHSSGEFLFVSFLFRFRPRLYSSLAWEGGGINWWFLDSCTKFAWARYLASALIEWVLLMECF